MRNQSVVLRESGPAADSGFKRHIESYTAERTRGNVGRNGKLEGQKGEGDMSDGERLLKVRLFTWAWLV